MKRSYRVTTFCKQDRVLNKKFIVDPNPRKKGISQEKLCLPSGIASNGRVKQWQGNKTMWSTYWITQNHFKISPTLKIMPLCWESKSLLSTIRTKKMFKSQKLKVTLQIRLLWFREIRLKWMFIEYIII